MKRGRLRVLLGAAPGVGKTYTMLEEGKRLRDEGRDVVVALLETHDRAATAAMLDELEVVPRKTMSHRSVTLGEMDTQAVLARNPEIALVDELAHTNAPGSAHAKRWQDIQDLLEAGIDVISTVNIQHIESLNDVVQQITGVTQRETVPDTVLRTADQIEVIDLAPESLQQRVAEGLVYAADRVDAALSNYFRLGNLTALRELALLWLADEVDTALQAYRAEHGISSKWEARERVVVGLTGGGEGVTLLRRGARIATRTAGSELLAVHVTSQDGLRHGRPGDLATQRALVERLGGTFHQVVGDDVARALVDFAQAANATQLVIGESRRSWLLSALTGPGIGASVIRDSGDIDVNVVNHAAAGSRFVLPRLSGTLSPARRLAGFAVALIGGPLLTWLLVAVRSDNSLTSDVLAFQLLVVVVALVGGMGPALFAALLSGLTLNFFFVAPLYTITVADPRQLLALALYIVIAALVSFVVDQAARRSRAARRAAAESELVATISGSVLRGEDALQALVARTREAFHLSGVRLRTQAGVILHTDGEPTGADQMTSMAVGSRAVLELYGADLAASERRLLTVIVAQIDAALEHNLLAQTARDVEPLAEADRLRSTLLTAVGHDLRRPLAAATAAVTGLRATDVILSEGDREELLATAAESLDSLAALVTNLLDIGRLEGGALTVSLGPVDVVDVVLAALDDLDLGPLNMDLALPVNLPRVTADEGLLQRVVVNIMSNAILYAPVDTRVRVSASTSAGNVRISISDAGPGITVQRGHEFFIPFQRGGDTENGAGVGLGPGLGLAVSQGFVEGMGGTLDAEETPGGGVTVVITLPEVPDANSGAARSGEETR
ncbi:histidine kinase [Cryobacterium sp. MLB-32]|uniref:sensor histidine kinase n=1 Tax=Cryobacterium sp. MLB-32 TaxID=1529318 RepID=UPI0004E723B8|nr:DUF4118 domain-containing protein [Cryobacterium sp. MLB-32]KFF60806.1 histidine kinase [Cryobacterium sp. MLB-32]